jgi:hypothetical protein
MSAARGICIIRPAVDAFASRPLGLRQKMLTLAATSHSLPA